MLSQKVSASILIMSVAACVTTPAPLDMTVTKDTRLALGWLQDGVEPILFPSPLSARYDPFTAENRRCISMINETALSSEELRRLHGKRVSVAGYAIAYSSFPTGTSEADKLMFNRYHEGRLVLNQCVREYIFVAQQITKLP